MKRLSLAIVFVCCTLAVAAQGDGFRVNYQGAKPTIKDFAKAYIRVVAGTDSGYTQAPVPVTTIQQR